MGSAAKQEPALLITTADVSLSSEQAGRQRKYLAWMAVRTGCVLAAIIVPGWPRWVLIAGAVILPYLAVVAANAGRARRTPHSKNTKASIASNTNTVEAGGEIISGEVAPNGASAHRL